MDYDLIVVKTLERVYKNYYYIIRGEFLLALVKNPFPSNRRNHVLSNSFLYNLRIAPAERIFYTHFD